MACTLLGPRCRPIVLDVHEESHSRPCGTGKEPITCPVCLEELKFSSRSKDEKVTMLRQCKHVFHRKCVKQWFMSEMVRGKTTPTCPVCRGDVERRQSLMSICTKKVCKNMSKIFLSRGRKRSSSTSSRPQTPRSPPARPMPYPRGPTRVQRPPNTAVTINTTSNTRTSTGSDNANQIPARHRAGGRSLPHIRGPNRSTAPHARRTAPNVGSPIANGNTTTIVPLRANPTSTQRPASAPQQRRQTHAPVSRPAPEPVSTRQLQRTRSVLGSTTNLIHTPPPVRSCRGSTETPVIDTGRTGTDQVGGGGVRRALALPSPAAATTATVTESTTSATTADNPHLC
eukprot:m.1352908 g.1352908  ORF g.1352908 m.1352908 type:complete len:342 (+) comp24928_c0_seq3:683-1708(+)